MNSAVNATNKMVRSSFFKENWGILLIIFLAVTTRFLFLWYPAEVVFDEVHFGKFVSAYFSGNYYFDIHPPLGKLLIAGFAKFWGFSGGFDFEKIGEVYSSQNLVILRFLPAFFGALFVFLVYKFTRALTDSKRAAFIAASLVLFDNAFLAEAKFVLVDSMLFAFGILALYLFVLGQRSKDLGSRSFFFLVMAGLAGGAALSIKWTGLAFPALILLLLAVDVFRQKRSFAETVEPEKNRPKEKPNSSNPAPARAAKFLAKAAAFIAAAGLVYLFSFYLHFSLLPKSGPGDAFMTPAFQKTLEGGAYRDGDWETPNFWQKFAELNKTMYAANAGLKATHPFSSQWYEWPIGRRPIYYWAGSNQKPGYAADIWLVGNPFGWILAAAAVLLAAFGLIFRSGRRRTDEIVLFLLLGFSANLLPFVGVKRVAFLYHYLPALTFGLILLAVIFDRLLKRQKTMILFLAFLIIFFLFLAPLSYGFAVPQGFHDLELKVVQIFG